MIQTTWVSRVRALGLAAAIMAVPASAMATLGGDTSSVDADRVRMQGALLRIDRSDAQTVHEVQSSSGTTVREYVSPSGAVFAVAQMTELADPNAWPVS